MGITSAAILYIVVFKRKRREFPYLAIPISFLLSGLIGIITEIFILKYQTGGNPDLVKTFALPLAIHYMFYTTGHQVFAS